MKVSFVIPAHDEAALIGKTIDALHAAARACGREYEIIVADDASADATGQIARERGCLVVRHERRQIAATRNLGARAARGEYLIFVDADTVIPAATLSEALAALDGGAVAGGAPISFDGPVPWFPRMVVWLFNVVFKRRGFTGGAFFFCRRADFEAAGGWDERFYAGEKLELAREMKKRGRFAFVQNANGDFGSQGADVQHVGDLPAHVHRGAVSEHASGPEQDGILVRPTARGSGCGRGEK